MSTDTTTTTGLMTGKRGLIMGVANERSIAWGIAEALASAAELAFTFRPRRFPAASFRSPNSVGSDSPCPATSSTMTTWTGRHRRPLAGPDFVVHAIAYSDKNELKGRYADTSRDNFRTTMDVSCFSFTNVARRAAPLMRNGGSLTTLTYLGAERTLPNYNVMGVAKAALEASVRYLVVDFGGDNIRVNAISAGPMRTLAGSAIGGARYVIVTERGAPLRRNVALDEVGRAGLYLASDLAAGVTGEVLYVDGGFAVGIPPDGEDGA